MIVLNEKDKAEFPTAAALGFFDGLHLGHIEVIKETLNRDGLKSAVMTFSEDTLLPKFKQSENILTHKQKLDLFEKIGVDYIFAPDFEEVRDLSSEEFVDKILVETLNAKLVSVGFDFRFGRGGRSTADELKKLCRERDITVKIIPAVMLMGRPVSSRAIREMIRKGDVELANWYLGYELTYELEVVHGAMLGRTLGAPTINQIIPETNVIPRFGVYKTWTIVDGKTYPSITNIGVKPTVKADKVVSMETHIIGFDGDLYGRIIQVVLREFIRDEKRFGDIYELKAQIDRDKQKALL